MRGTTHTQPLDLPLENRLDVLHDKTFESLFTKHMLSHPVLTDGIFSRALDQAPLDGDLNQSLDEIRTDVTGFIRCEMPDFYSSLFVGPVKAHRGANHVARPRID